MPTPTSALASQMPAWLLSKLESAVHTGKAMAARIRTEKAGKLREASRRRQRQVYIVGDGPPSHWPKRGKVVGNRLVELVGFENSQRSSGRRP